MSYLKHLSRDFLNPALFDALTGHKVEQHHLRRREDDAFMTVEQSVEGTNQQKCLLGGVPVKGPRWNQANTKVKVGLRGTFVYFEYLF